MKERLKRFAPLILVLVLLSVSLIYLVSVTNRGKNHLEISGTIESIKTTLASELGGMVSEVTVQEGDRVHSGQVLVRFDDTSIQAQVAQAQAALLQAQANRARVQAQTEQEVLAAQQALDDLYENADLAYAAAQMAVVNARDELARAENEALAASKVELEYAQMQQKLEDLLKERGNLNYQNCKESRRDSAYADYLLAKDRYEELQEDYDSYYAHKAEDDLSRANALGKVSASKEVYERALANLNYCQNKGDALDVSEKDAQIHLAQAQVEELKRDWESYLEKGPNSKKQALINQARARLELAQNELKKLKKGPDPDALALAEARLALAKTALATADAQVQAAEAALQVVRVQLDKTSVSAPDAAAVIVRAVEPGEVVSPGTALIVLSMLDDLTLTVYLPEDRYGQVSIGDEAVVTVDSFPGVEFSARVTRIADEAEFTPRNVQTGEGRRSTVYAIELSVQDDEGKLKPGMPADIQFK